MDKESRSTRVEIIEPLRGLAAMSVACFHFTNGGALLASDSWLRMANLYGWMGVEVFFVISGFIVPYSLWVGGYRFPMHWPTFVLKRMIRLDPPYLVAIVVAVGLAYWVTYVPSYAGGTPNFTMLQLLAHLGYVNAFLGYDWVVVVFWTLAIEFQFYLLVAVIFPVLASGSMAIRLAGLATMCGLSLLITPSEYVFRYGGFFALGAAAFQKYIGLSTGLQCAVTLGAIAVVVAVMLGPVIATVALVTALLISFVKIRRYGPLAFVGALSYSIYLLHVPIGGRVINLGTRFADTFALQVLVLLAAVVVTLGASYVLYRFVERPAQRWSSAIRYRPHSESSLETGSCAAETVQPLVP